MTSKQLSKRAKVPNLAQAAKSEPFVTMKWICRQSIPSIYAQKLLMGPKYNIATCVKDLGTTNTSRSSNHLSKRAKVPNLAQAAKSEPFVTMKWICRQSIPSIYAQRLLMGPKYNVATCVEELGSTNTFRRSKHLRRDRKSK